MRIVWGAVVYGLVLLWTWALCKAGSARDLPLKSGTTTGPKR